jgi:hypothetical protein
MQASCHFTRKEEAKMRTIGHRCVSLATTGMLWFGFGRTAVAQTAAAANVIGVETVTVTVYRVKDQPTVRAAKTETRSRAPSKDAVWIPGFWTLQADRNTAPRAGWVWVSGQWLTPPFRGASWIPAHWGYSDDWWSWDPGHWSRHNIFVQPPLSDG